MKKKTIKSKLNFDKRVISKFKASQVKGGSRRGCVGTNNCGPTTGTNNCDATLTGTAAPGCPPPSIGCPIT